jgi:hypothetical protein
VKCGSGCFSRKRDPDLVALKVQSYVPLAQSSAVTNNYLPVFPLDRRTTIPSIKIDQLFGPQDKVSFYFAQTRTDSHFRVRLVEQTACRNRFPPRSGPFSFRRPQARIAKIIKRIGFAILLTETE